MRSYLQRVFLLATLAVLPACGGGGGGGGSSVATGTPAAAPPGGAPVTGSSLQETVQEAVNRGVYGVNLTVLHDDGQIDTHVAGRRNRDSGEAMTPRSVFKMASVSKLYVAVAAIQLVEQGLLRLDDTIVLHLPDLSDRIENADVITLRQLLQHRSGVPDFDSQVGFSWRTSHTDNARVLSYALDLPADFPPGSRYQYSNTNYLLAAMMLDAALGYSHRVQIQDHILSPLGLTDTFHLLNEAAAAELVSGYWDRVDTTTRDYVVPGGSMLATGEDIARFLSALATGALFTPAAQQTYRSVYWYEHSGWLPGYQTIARYESALRATVVLHINNTGGLSEEILAETYDEVVARLR